MTWGTAMSMAPRGSGTGTRLALSSLCSISTAFPLEPTKAFLFLWETELDIHGQYSHLLNIALNVTDSCGEI